MNSQKRLYCPRCEKSINAERLEEVKQELENKFDNSALDEGVCPVCGTTLIQMDGQEV